MAHFVQVRLFPGEEHVHQSHFQPGLMAFNVQFDTKDSPAVLLPIEEKDTP